MKLVCILFATWLTLNIGVQAQSHHLGQDTPKTAPDPTADYVQMYQDARRSFDAGNYDDAEQQVQVVLGKYPHYTPAVNLLAMIKQRKGSDRSGALRRKLEEIIIPRVNFRDALVESALDFLRNETRRLDPDKK